MIRLIVIGVSSLICLSVAALSFLGVFDLQEDKNVVAVQWLLFGSVIGILFIYFGGFNLLRSRSNTTGSEADADEELEVDATDGVFGVPRVISSRVGSAATAAGVGAAATASAAATYFGSDSDVEAEQPSSLEAALFASDPDVDGPHVDDGGADSPAVSIFGRSDSDEPEDELEVVELDDLEGTDDINAAEVEDLEVEDLEIEDLDTEDLEDVEYLEVVEDANAEDLEEILEVEEVQDYVEDTEVEDTEVEAINDVAEGVVEVDTTVADGLADSTGLQEVAEDSTTVVFPVSSPATDVEVRRYTSTEVMATVKKQESHLVDTLIHEGLLTTEGPITDRDVRTMVFVAVSSKELVEVLTGDLGDGATVEISAPAAQAELASESPAELTD